MSEHKLYYYLVMILMYVYFHLSIELILCPILKDGYLKCCACTLEWFDVGDFKWLRYVEQWMINVYRIVEQWMINVYRIVVNNLGPPGIRVTFPKFW
jgi:hypothetical protein